MLRLAEPSVEAQAEVAIKLQLWDFGLLQNQVQVPVQFMTQVLATHATSSLNGWLPGSMPM